MLISIKYRKHPFELYHKLQDCLSEDYKSVNLKKFIVMMLNILDTNMYVFVYSREDLHLRFTV